MIKTEVSANIELAPGIYALSFPRLMPFTAGQVISVTSHFSIPPRMYSIASAPNASEMQIVYDIKPDGLLTNILKTLLPGNTIYISEPFGKFISTAPDSVYIATGTGIAPFYAMLLSDQIKGGTVIHGARSKELFLFSDEFSERLGKEYVQCCSGNPFENAFHGRITKYLSQQQHLPGNVRYFLCGSAEMVVEVRDLLISKGIAFHLIVAEIYF